MDTSIHHLAQVNVARMIAPLTDPVMSDFVAQLAYVNGVADRSPGFVWRFQTDEGDATSLRAFDDDRILFNMSVWESEEALFAYVYRSDHLGPMRDRRRWFEPMDDAHMALWWIRAGTIPTVSEACARLDLLRANGAGPEAFTFREPYAPDGTRRAAPARGREPCET